jgi:hypothetical protein
MSLSSPITLPPTSCGLCMCAGLPASLHLCVSLPAYLHACAPTHSPMCVCVLPLRGGCLFQFVFHFLQKPSTITLQHLLIYLTVDGRASDFTLGAFGEPDGDRSHKTLGKVDGSLWWSHGARVGPSLSVYSQSYGCGTPVSAPGLRVRIRQLVAVAFQVNGWGRPPLGGWHMAD